MKTFAMFISNNFNTAVFLIIYIFLIFWKDANAGSYVIKICLGDNKNVRSDRVNWTQEHYCLEFSIATTIISNLGIKWISSNWFHLKKPFINTLTKYIYFFTIRAFSRKKWEKLVSKLKDDHIISTFKSVKSCNF